jgi:hypothetical protein
MFALKQVSDKGRKDTRVLREKESCLTIYFKYGKESKHTITGGG